MEYRVRVIVCVPGGTPVFKGKVLESVTVTVFAGGTFGVNTNVFVVKVIGFVVEANAFVVEVNVFVTFTVGTTEDLIPGSGVEEVTLDEGLALDADSGVCGEVYT